MPLMKESFQAQNITWGMGKGCDFATRSCKELMDASSGTSSLSGNKEPRSGKEATDEAPFCNTLMHTSPKTSCTQDGLSVGSCNMVMYNEDLPDIYQVRVDT